MTERVEATFGTMWGDGPTRGPLLVDHAGWLEQHAFVLFDTDERGRITRPNEPEPTADAPRMFVARGHRRSLTLFRADVPDDVVSELGAIAGALPAWDGERTHGGIRGPLRDGVRAWLGETEESHGPAFRFRHVTPVALAEGLVLIDAANAHLLERNFPYTRSVLDQRLPIVGAVRGGSVVAACYAARRRATACEAGVATVEEYRGQGLAVAVVGMWAGVAMAAGMTPLYSTSWSNVASLRVAAALALDAYADTLSYR